MPIMPEIVKEQKEIIAFSLVLNCLKRKALGATFVLEIKKLKKDRRAKDVSWGCW